MRCALDPWHLRTSFLYSPLTFAHESRGSPDWAQSLFDALVAAGIFPKDAPPNHIIVNEYTPGIGMSAHKDGPMYAPRVAILTLSAAGSFDFIRHGSAGDSPEVLPEVEVRRHVEATPLDLSSESPEAEEPHAGEVAPTFLKWEGQSLDLSDAHDDAGRSSLGSSLGRSGSQPLDLCDTHDDARDREGDESDAHDDARDREGDESGSESGSSFHSESVDDIGAHHGAIHAPSTWSGPVHVLHTCQVVASLALPPRSLLVFTDEAYHDCLHAVNALSVNTNRAPPPLSPEAPPLVPPSEPPPTTAPSEPPPTTAPSEPPPSEPPPTTAPSERPPPPLPRTVSSKVRRISMTVRRVNHVMCEEAAQRIRQEALVPW